MNDDWKHGGFGIYIHWPFCQSKCPYCDFNSHVVAKIDHDIWCEAYLTELDRYAQIVPGRVVHSIFFGGGTPSLMPSATVDKILNRIALHWPLANDVEVTLEANPGSVEVGRFQDYRKSGVNRVSLGVQALNPEDLRKLGRLHTVDEARRAMDTAQLCFDRNSFDLIYARQDQSISAWEAELAEALTFGYSHLSLYSLTIEPGTAFGSLHSLGKLKGLPDEDLSADLYDLTVSMCETSGLGQYEVSNFAAPEESSIHNKIYWKSGDYVGIGPGAHGRITNQSGIRFATETHTNPGKWLSMVKLGQAETENRALTLVERGDEMVLMGLRLAEGIDVERLEASTGLILPQENIRELLELRAIAYDGRILNVQPGWFNLLNRIIEKVVPD